jgi:6-phosphogluconolactonase (cycloisomerase 2 family)
MKFSQIGRITKATILSLAIGLGMTACSSDYTIDYLYVTASRATTGSPDGSISAYKVDNQSGALTQIVDSPYSSGGRNPVDIVLSPNNKALYVLNHDDSTIVEFLIGTDGKIYPQSTYNLGLNSATVGSFPISAVVDPTNSFLLVAFSYQHGYTTASPGPGGITVFPISGSAYCPATSAIPANGLCTPLTFGTYPYLTIGNNPAAIGVAPLPAAWTGNTIYTAGQLIEDGTNVELVTVAGTSGSSTPSWNKTVGGTTADGSVTWKNVSPVYSYVYAVDQESTGGTVLGLLLSESTGTPTLTTLTGTTISNTSPTVASGYAAGVLPHGIAEDPTGRFVYVTDQSSNHLIGYTVQAGGSLHLMVNAPFATGLDPEGIVVDPRGKYVYVTNYNNSTVSGYAIDPATGNPAGVYSNGVSTTGTGPTCVTVEPSQGIYLYTSNFVDNTVTGLQLDPHTGALVNIQNTPFNAAGNPTCAVTVSAGAHAYQAVQP